MPRNFGVLVMETLWQDLKYGFRTMAKGPGFAAVIILTLALGIGANTAIFSVVYGVLLRPLPYPDPGRLTQISISYKGRLDYSGFDAREFDFWKTHGQPFQYLAATTSVGFNLSSGSQPMRVRALRVSKDYFRVMGVQPALGREFTQDEDSLSGPSVVILSYGLWKSQFGGDGGLVGKTVSLDGTPYSVVGIMPAGFQSIPPVDVWTTIGQVAHSIGSGINYTVIGRLKSGISGEQADSYLSTAKDSFFKEFRPRYSKYRQGIAFHAEPLRSMVSFNYHTPLLVLFGAIGFVLLIACVNVANLLMSRAAARGKEIAIRTALGAGRGRLFRQLLTESLLLAVLGGALGLFFAYWVLDLLLALAPTDLPRAHAIYLDGWALGFTVLVSLLTGVFFGLAPAFQSSKVDLNNSLKESVGRATSGMGRRRLRSALAVCEIALSLVLLTGAALLIETFTNLTHTNPGFDPHPILTLQTWTTGQKFTPLGTNPTSAQENARAAAINRFYEGILQKVQAIPGVQSAAVVGEGLPLETGGNDFVWLPSEGESRGISADVRSISLDYFRTMGIPLLQGRLFSVADSPTAGKVVVINEAFVREKFPHRSPIGQHAVVGGTPCEIVGVVGDVKSAVGEPVPSTVFIPLAQDPGEIQGYQAWFPVAILVRTAQLPLSLSHALETAVHDAEPDLPIGHIQSMEQILSTSLAFQRFLMTLMSIFAALALILAAVGIYGVMAYSVGQRTHEIGIRMALGARPRDVLVMVVRHGMLLTLIGLIAGLAGAFATTRFLADQLYGVQATDPIVFAIVVGLLAFIALLACYIPARRAAKVDPLIALRYE
ncbi:MAG TPA: ABC transporter permease [Candidatus Acidoferrales bacterium]|nr:ABC transporter permease [Candidatus Acidoferrales bacterium]